MAREEVRKTPADGTPLVVMADVLTRAQRSRNMASIRSRDNASTELAFKKLLSKQRISGWRRYEDLPGRPDFVFRKERVAVFVDGCFWHGCPRCYRLPDQHRPYWRKKTRSNRVRDLRVTKELRQRGWHVLRVWEHSLESQAGRTAILRRLHSALSQNLLHEFGTATSR